MKISEIKHGQKELLELRVFDEFKKEENARYKFINYDNCFYLQCGNDAPAKVEAASKKYSDVLSLLLSRNLPMLVDVISYDKQKSAVFAEVYSFSREILADFDIVVQDEVIDFCRRKNKRINTIDEATKWLSDESMISFDKEVNSCFFLGLPIVSDNMGSSLDNFMIKAQKFMLCVSQKQDTDGNSFFSVDKISEKLKIDDYTFYPVWGKHQYVDKTRTSASKIETMAMLAEIGSSIESYLNTWQKYGEIEKKIVVDLVKEAGVLRFDHVEPTSSGFKVSIRPEDYPKIPGFKEKYKKVSAIEIASEHPDFLFADKFALSDYDNFVRACKKNGIFIGGSVSRVKDNEFFIEIDTEIDKELTSGYIYLGLKGDMNRFSRREDSRNKILQGLSPMPHLAAILEGRAVTTSKPTSHSALSHLVNKEIFAKNRPTARQKEAIELALNTPDICIIQGPPGTGKTTVITAILKRLNEISGSTGEIKGRNLVSAYQHDAVQNAVERIEIFGLPAIKFGGRRSELSESSLMNRKIEQWRLDTLEKLKPLYDKIKSNYHFSDFYKLYESYMLSPLTAVQALQMLNSISHLINGKISSESYNKLCSIRNELSLETSKADDPERLELIKIIRRIPLNQAALLDGGLFNIKRAAYSLEDKFPEQFKTEIYDLKKISSSQLKDDERVFLYLKNLQKKILLKLIPQEIPFIKPKSRVDIEILLNNIKEELSEYEKRALNNEDKILYDYYSELDDNPLAAQDAIFDYTAVGGATCQQAVGGEIAKFKIGKAKENTSKHDAVYDNVLIDEAARSNPLDLFIPMSLAQKRIIMVGDHRQLPHIIEESIIEEIENDINDESNAEDLKSKINRNIKESLFEHLFKEIKNLEKKDGIKRTVTLDEQYRTHPVLGKFVSENFYEKNGESEIRSGLPADFFKHNLPGVENKAVIWLDVPGNRGAEGKNGTSRIRKIEAERIAEHLNSMIHAPQSAGFSFGIITFYAAQVEEIKDSLLKYGITFKNDSEKVEINPDYKEEKVGTKIIEKLRIGTVDAFQGMEFDFVYLSMVRSNNSTDASDVEQRRKYGHLMSDNRLCVSMSRQKKALICVGDSNMLKSANAKTAVGALVEYYKLCKESEYGCII